MKLRFGGMLAMALGAVLIGNGLSQSTSGTVGVAPGTVCQSFAAGALTPAGNCPTGTITITDETPAGSGVPADWDVTITSACLNPATGLPVNVTLTVPTGGSVTSTNLYIFTAYGATASSPKCSYSLAREADPAFTATFTPPSPVTIPFSDGDTNSGQRVARVTLVNAALVPTTSAAPSTSASSSPTGSASDDPTSSSASSSASAAPVSDTQGAAPIAETGPRESITTSLWLGIGLVLLGLVLLFEGRTRKLGKHRD